MNASIAPRAIPKVFAASRVKVVTIAVLKLHSGAVSTGSPVSVNVCSWGTK